MAPIRTMLQSVLVLSLALAAFGAGGRRMMLGRPEPSICTSKDTASSSLSKTSARSRSLQEECADRLVWCTSWASQGYCDAKYVWEGQSVKDYQCPLACGTCTTSTETPPSVTDTPPTGTEDDMLAAVNAARQSNGAAPLRIDDRLMRAAQKQSDYQQEIQTMTHNGRDGVSLGGRVSAEGFTWSAVAENVAWGQQDVASVMQSWMNSPGHRANLLSSAYTSFGWGRAGNYWTQVFAA